MLSAQRRWEELTKGLAANATPRFTLGFYEASLAIDRVFEVPSLSDFRELLARSLRNHSGWPPFLVIDRPPYKPRIVDGAIETWMGPDVDGSMSVPSHCDFWRIAPEGLFYTRRGFDEDGRLKSVEPGRAFALTTPIWRIGEIVLQAHYVAVALGAEDANLLGRFGWKGISGRQLVSIDDRYLSMARTAHQDVYETEVTMGVRTIPTALPEIVFGILDPLYQLFDFFRLSKRMVEEELAKMMRHQYHQ